MGIEGSAGPASKTKRRVVADDPAVAYAAFAERLKATDNSRHRAMLQTFLAHSRAEAVFDLDGTMATLVPEPTYYTFGGPGGDDAPKGYQAVRAMYRDLFAMGGIANMRGEVADIVIDDRTIFFHSRLTSVVPWGRAKEAGYAISDERGHYAVHKRVAVVLPFDDKGLILGETAYVATDVHDFEPLGEDELSPGYIRWLKRFAPDT